MYNLGLDHRNTSNKPIILTEIPGIVKDVSTSENSSFFLTTKGIYYCGITEEFKMKNATKPTKIFNENEKINQISSGNHFYIGFYSSKFEDSYDEKNFKIFKLKLKFCEHFTDIQIKTNFDDFDEIENLTKKLGEIKIKK